MTSLPFRFLIKVAAFIGVLFLLSAKTYTPCSFYEKGTFKPVLPNPEYEIIITPDAANTDEYFIYAIDLATNQAPVDDMQFFIVLPEGNFINLNKSSVLNGDPTTYKAKIRFQHFNSDPQLVINEIQAFANKKNDPSIPKGKVAGEIKVRFIDTDNSGKTAISPPVYTGMTSKYLDVNEYIKLGISWFPWDHTNAYYYQIITFRGRDDNNFRNSNGYINLTPCSLDNTGFVIDSFFTYDRKKTDVWQGSELVNGAQVFYFSDLEANEVRHIYVRLKRTGPAADSVAYYSSTINYTNEKGTIIFEQELDCLKIPVRNAPHDPNKKVVDQIACTANGSGKLTYTIHFQNEGNGFAKNVKIYDILPPELDPYIIDQTSITSSFSGTVLFFQEQSNPKNIRFELNNMMLPGSSQTVPQIYDYMQTTGWVKFTCSATCPSNGQSIENHADIVFVSEQNIEMPPISTESIKTVADNELRPNWNMGCLCNAKNCHRIFRCRRCHWYFCIYKKCYPVIKTLNNSK